MAAIPGGVDDGDRVRLQLLLDLPGKNNKNMSATTARDSVQELIASTCCDTKIRRSKKNQRGVARSTLASSNCMAGDSADPAGPGTDAQTENPPALGLQERRGGDQAVNLVVEEDGEERARAP